MITLSKGGAYLIGGTEVVETGAGSEELLKNKLGDKYLTKEDAAKNTMAYGILNEHNTSGNMDKLQIKFDKLHPMILHLLESFRQQELQD